MKTLFAIRGAVRCENTNDDICKQVALMYGELLAQNKLEEADIVSVVFSVTEDLTAVNPCTALRKSGYAGDLALFSAQEPKVDGAMERVVRLLIHCYLEEGSVVKHVYRNGAEALRPDRIAMRK